MDMVAARHPGLTVVMAHFGYPWHLEVLASAMHKTNVWVDLSGWRPKYIPDEVKRDGNGGIDPASFERSVDQIAVDFKFQKRPSAADIFDDSFLPPPGGRVIN